MDGLIIFPSNLNFSFFLVENFNSILFFETFNLGIKFCALLYFLGLKIIECFPHGFISTVSCVKYFCCTASLLVFFKDVCLILGFDREYVCNVRFQVVDLCLIDQTVFFHDVVELISSILSYFQIAF